MRPILIRVDMDDIVESVPFDWHLGGIADQAENALARQAGGTLCPGGVAYLLLTDGPVQVISPEVEGDGCGLLADHHPVGLDVWDVVQNQPGGSDCLQVL